ncbi:MAG: vitamin B12-transporter protein BtuF [Methanosaeta sp. PtaU1.Bin060]|jgi:iron complex transport system substrate-binding protein|uniref:Periplasmic binding protein n=1 Tax=Methanothrix soehngenii (strain ATCC 5969 / DSM 3671 / JCM 10134 / NBRC 103675 / OCM 69 / GP-6) TaxID=990316 RepID=F4BYT4_METSG|nr:periplasmic binding protein [Methanothrix soehngenii GP6]OPY54023.1 MAG: vitamin B12-transporter protein BtuF [Methanosaeta sp. PtaU1.Bin060]
MIKYMKLCKLASICFCFILGAALASEETRTVVDGRGASVQVPAEIDRVVTISDGLVEEVMTVLGVQDKLVGLGSECLPKVWQIDYPTVNGGNFSYHDGMNVVNYLNPKIKDLPLVAKSGVAPNYEVLAGLKPDVIIVRAGDCTFWKDKDGMKKAIDSIESLGIPLVVTYGPNTCEKPSLDKLSEELRIVGQVFGKEDQADKLARYLESEVDTVRERTRDIPNSEKPSMLLFGLSPQTRGKGAAGDAWGLNTIESYFLENIVNARNAFHEQVSTEVVNAERVLAINPDAIVLPTDFGYHPPREIYEAPYYQNLQELDAIKNKRVMALPWSPCNCDKRLEYPIDVMVMAKAAYPDRFKDIDLGEWLLEFYQNVYGVDRETAEGLRSAQWMDWTAE